MLFALYALSTLYHSTRGKVKRVFRKLDHCSIYLLIAGTYTPFTLVTLRGAWGWSLFGVIWGLAALGIAQEAWFGKGARVLSVGHLCPHGLAQRDRGQAADRSVDPCRVCLACSGWPVLHRGHRFLRAGRERCGTDTASGICSCSRAAPAITSRYCFMWREPSLLWSRNVNPWSAPVAVVDTGLASGIRNAAIDRAWLELRANGHGSDVLRLHRSHPTASVGRHQALDRELRLDYCLQHGIEVVRRASSGGALYLDPDQLGFSLIVRRPAAWRELALAQLLALGSAAVAAGLAQLGIAATFKSPNDIEVGGRKIASVFAACRNDAVLLHGSVLLDADIETMLKALRMSRPRNYRPTALRPRASASLP